jgi:hypothetical protein
MMSPPFSLRRLFVRILIHCQSLHPEQLWRDFKIAFSENYRFSINDANGAENLAYVN